MTVPQKPSRKASSTSRSRSNQAGFQFNAQFPNGGGFEFKMSTWLALLSWLALLIVLCMPANQERLMNGLSSLLAQFQSQPTQMKK